VLIGLRGLIRRDSAPNRAQCGACRIGLHTGHHSDLCVAVGPVRPQARRVVRSVGDHRRRVSILRSRPPRYFSGVTAAICIALFGSSALYAVLPAYVSELFKPRVRYSGISINYNLASGLIGGFSPAISSALLASAGALGQSRSISWAQVSSAPSRAGSAVASCRKSMKTLSFQ
jgi:MFS family permease